VQVLRKNGGRVAWSAANNLIAYDKKGADGYYDIYVMKPDGSNDRCITCNKKGLVPQKNNGNPAWHPSGKYIVFQAEKTKHPGSSREATPGFGRYSDLWLARKDGKRFYQLTKDPASKDQGVLHPHFSHNGKLLSWSEMYERPHLFKRNQQFGLWKLKVADFSFGPRGPYLSNIREYEPGGPGFYENHGLSKDNRKLLYTSNTKAPIFSAFRNDVFVLDLRSGKSVQLTSKKYNEHAQWSPNGAKILWMSSVGNRGGATDYWLMNPNGTKKVRLTDLSTPDNPIARGRRLIAADSAWSPDGSRIVAYVQTNLFKQAGVIVMIKLPPEIAREADVRTSH